MRVLWLPLLLAACNPAQAVLRDPSAGDPFYGDSGAPTTTDTGTTPGDTNPPAPQPDFNQWHGQRTFEFDDIFGTACTDSVDETGTNVTESADYAGALDACPDCDDIYEVTNDPDHVCEDATGGRGIPVANPVVRGIERIGETEIRLYSLQYDQWRQTWQAEELATGPLDGFEFTYEYDGTAGFNTSYHVTGYVDFQ